MQEGGEKENEDNVDFLLGTGDDDDGKEGGEIFQDTVVEAGLGDSALPLTLTDASSELLEGLGLAESATGRGDGVGREVDEADMQLPPVPDASAAAAIEGIALRNGQGNVTSASYMSDKVARCKVCGVVISRDMLAIEAHMEICGTNKASNATRLGGIGGCIANSAQQGGRDINKFGTRIIYRTARQSKRTFRPREVCALQDSFIDPDGTCYLYEVSVRHCDVRGTPGYVTADVLTMMHVARPIKGARGACSITIVSQVDTRGKGTGQWLMSFLTAEEGREIGVRTEDLVRELQLQGNLQDMLRREQEDEGAKQCSLEDFELLAVLGRGGFGKVMQVRHRGTLKIYAMKVCRAMLYVNFSMPVKCRIYRND